MDIQPIVERSAQCGADGVVSTTHSHNYLRHFSSRRQSKQKGRQALYANVGDKALKQKCTTTITTLIVLASLSVSGQSLPIIKLDSLVKTREFYSWMYDKERNEHGYWGIYWLLDNNLNLYFGRTGHHPPSNIKKRVGSWELQEDSVILTVSRPKDIGLTDPTIFRYRIFQVEWTTNTGFTAKDDGEPLILKSIGIILSDNRDFNVIQLTEKLNKYVKDHYIPTKLSQEEESIRDWDNHDQVEKLVRQYLNKEKIVVGIKQYRNNELWVR